MTNNKVNSKDIETQSLSIFPQYEYPNGKQQLVGQTASQTLKVTVRNIDSKDSKGGNVGTLIDQLVGINGIQFNNLIFDKGDKT